MSIKVELKTSLTSTDITHKIAKDFFHENLETFDMLNEQAQDKMIDKYFDLLKNETKTTMFLMYFQLREGK